MADNQSSLNENLIAAGLNTSNPTSTYVDFAEQVAKNQAEQAQQEQALALAKQHVAQATLDTKQRTEADQAGVNPELKDVMSKDQALAQIKLLIETKGLPLDEKALQALAGTLPAMVPASQIEVFANRFARAIAKFGQATEISTDQIIKVPSGKSAADLGLVYDASMKTDDKEPSDGTKTAHVPDGGMYQIVIDEAGNVIRYALGGKELVDPSIKAAQHSADLDRKDWKALGVQLTKAFTTRSGGLGSISTAIFRATRAIMLIERNGSQLTAQDLENVAQDIGGIFQGGAPTVVSAEGNNYETAFTNFQNTFRKYTGFLIRTPDAVIRDTENKMLGVLNDLRESAIQNIDKYAEFQIDIFSDLRKADPEKWEKVKSDYIAMASSGLRIPPGTNTPLHISGADQAYPTSHTSTAPAAGAGNQDKKDALRKKLGLPTQGK